MTGSQRIAIALNHAEPDHVPFDIGAMNVSSISSVLLRQLLDHLGMDDTFSSCDIIQRIGTPPDTLKRKLGIDTERIGPDRTSVPGGFPLWSDPDKTYTLTDAWHIAWEMRPGDHYFHQMTRPLDTGELGEALADYRMQGPPDSLTTMVSDRLGQDGQYQAVLDRDCAGLFEMSQRLRGMEDLMIDLMLDRANVERLAEQLFQYKLAYWERMLANVGDRHVVVAEADDYGADNSLLISPDMVRSIYLSRYRMLFAQIKRWAPNAKICFHSCGAVRQLIPDFIEAGVDILNPVQYSAGGMDLAGLKRDFGKDITFWGACVDTSDILPHGSPLQVSDEVKRVLDILAPGGGFVAAAVHNIQADVPLKNVLALIDTVREYGSY